MGMNAYAGRMAFVDLTTSRCRTVEFDESFARTWLGGNGFAAKIIHENVAPGAAPYSPENVVVFAQGPANGAPFWGGNRGLVAAISPITNGFFDSVYGGDFAWALKQAGWDVVVIGGEAEKPVFVHVTPDAVRIEEAGEIWGYGVERAIAALRSRVGARSECAVIGPAAENRVVFGSVMCSGRRLSAAGRGGIGSVMGAKRCKAVVASGRRDFSFYDSAAVKDQFGRMKPGLLELGAGLREMGTPMLVNFINDRGMLCTRNNNAEVFENAARISGEVIRDTYKKRNIACRGCGLACGKSVAVPSGKYAGSQVKMPEYETLYALGSMLGNDDIVSIFNANALCDDLGIDTISFGVTLAFLIECSEKGILPSDDLKFGAQDGIERLVEATAYRRGRVGEYLAMGSAAAAKELGEESKEYLYTAKGLEIPGHSARGLRMTGISYATSHRGGTHHDGRQVYYPNDPPTDPGFSDMVLLSLNTFNNSTVGDCLLLCRFIHERTFGKALAENMVRFIGALTGWVDYSLDELTATAERICTLERLISVERGFDRRDDTLPYRVRTTPIPSGPAAGRYCGEEDLGRMLDEYYRLREWDDRGRPTAETLRRLRIARGEGSDLRIR